MGRKRAWTVAEKAYLKRTWTSPKYTREAIGRRLCRTPNACGNMASRLGLKRPLFMMPSTDEDIHLISCYGKDFTSGCVDSCPGWLKCMEICTAARVAEGWNLDGRKFTVTGSLTGAQVVAAIREAVKELDQVETI